jgi:hypothetical protein
MAPVELGVLIGNLFLGLLVASGLQNWTPLLPLSFFFAAPCASSLPFGTISAGLIMSQVLSGHWSYSLFFYLPM